MHSYKRASIVIDNIERMSAKAAVNEDRTRWDYLKRIGKFGLETARTTTVSPYMRLFHSGQVSTALRIETWHHTSLIKILSKSKIPRTK